MKTIRHVTFIKRYSQYSVMKTLFIHAHSTRKVKIPASVVKKLPKKVGIVASIQFANQVPAIVKQIPGSVAG
jgi:hypothetical protein